MGTIEFGLIMIPLQIEQKTNTEAEAWFNALPALWETVGPKELPDLCQWCTKSEHQTPLPPAKTLYLR